MSGTVHGTGVSLQRILLFEDLGAGVALEDFDVNVVSISHVTFQVALLCTDFGAKLAFECLDVANSVY